MLLLVGRNRQRILAQSAELCGLFQPEIDKSIGLDLGLGVLWRPNLSENVVITGGLTGLLPGEPGPGLRSAPARLDILPPPGTP